MNSTQNLKYDHITIRRIKNIAQICSNNLYANKHVRIEDIGTNSSILYLDSNYLLPIREDMGELMGTHFLFEAAIIPASIVGSILFVAI
jgi:hypothetical protein